MLCSDNNLALFFLHSCTAFAVFQCDYMFFGFDTVIVKIPNYVDILRGKVVEWRSGKCQEIYIKRRGKSVNISKVSSCQ